MEKGRVWLVFEDDRGLAPVLIKRLKSAGQEVVTVAAGNGFRELDAHTFTMEPANSQHYDLLIRALQSS